MSSPPAAGTSSDVVEISTIVAGVFVGILFAAVLFCSPRRLWCSCCPADRPHPATRVPELGRAFFRLGVHVLRPPGKAGVPAPRRRGWGGGGAGYEFERCSIAPAPGASSAAARREGAGAGAGAPPSSHPPSSIFAWRPGAALFPVPRLLGSLLLQRWAQEAAAAAAAAAAPAPQRASGGGGGVRVARRTACEATEPPNKPDSV